MQAYLFSFHLFTSEVDVAQQEQQQQLELTTSRLVRDAAKILCTGWTGTEVDRGSVRALGEISVGDYDALFQLILRQLADGLSHVSLALRKLPASLLATLKKHPAAHVSREMHQS